MAEEPTMLMCAGTTWFLCGREAVEDSAWSPYQSDGGVLIATVGQDTKGYNYPPLPNWRKITLPCTYAGGTTRAHQWATVLEAVAWAVENRFPIVVHCNQGVHRSPLVMALLLGIHGGAESVDDALRQLAGMRQIWQGWTATNMLMKERSLHEAYSWAKVKLQEHKVVLATRRSSPSVPAASHDATASQGAAASQGAQCLVSKAAEASDSKAFEDSQTASTSAQVPRSRSPLAKPMAAKTLGGPSGTGIVAPRYKDHPAGPAVGEALQPPPQGAAVNQQAMPAPWPIPPGRRRMLAPHLWQQGNCCSICPRTKNGNLPEITGEHLSSVKHCRNME
ncbi:unnamed protein product, partial [Durusdinium trenchii]